MKSSFMTIFLFELKRRGKGMGIWVAAWLFFSLLILAFYDALVASAEQLTQLLSQLPPQLLAALGSNIESITTLEGIINSRLVSFSIIIGGVWAGWLGSQLIGKDETTGALTWLITQPVKRATVYWAKLAALCVWLLVVNLVIMSGTAIQADILTSVTNINLGYFLLIAIGLSIYYIFVASIGNLATAIWREERGRMLAIFVVMLSYTMNVVRAFIPDNQIVPFFTSFYYFDPDYVGRTTTLGNTIWLLFIATIIAMISGAWYFNRRDIQT
jgi:ABC-type transport system involved in multi-copper enzyme maturation permease subunit